MKSIQQPSVADTAQHTPGPWQAKHAESADAKYFEVRGRNDTKVCTVGFFAHHDVLFRTTAAANAQLIAAAPDLLRALRESALLLAERAVYLSRIDAIPAVTIPAKGRRAAFVVGTKRLSESESRELTLIRGVFAQAKAAIAAATGGAS